MRCLAGLGGQAVLGISVPGQGSSMFMFHVCGEQKLTRRDPLKRAGYRDAVPQTAWDPLFLTHPVAARLASFSLTLCDIRKKQHHQSELNTHTQPAWRWTRSGGRRARQFHTLTTQGTPRAQARTATSGPGSKFRWGRTPQSRKSRCRRYWPSLSVNPFETRQLIFGLTLTSRWRTVHGPLVRTCHQRWSTSSHRYPATNRTAIGRHREHYMDPWRMVRGFRRCLLYRRRSQ